MTKNAILSPADGTIIDVVTCMEERFLKAEALKVSIFMSVLDVHLNRAPVAGKVIERSYNPGRFLVASKEKASLLNEQNALILETEDHFKILLIQIAGSCGKKDRLLCKSGRSVAERRDLWLDPFRIEGRPLPPGDGETHRVDRAACEGRRVDHRVSGMKKKKPQIKMKKGIYILPNLFTTGNLFCGFWSIISVFQEKYFYAAVAILLAAVFDALDGKVAKLSGATSKFGVQYDSLADLVSFGVAPALMAFSWALRPYGKFGWLAAFLFVVCGALRLARFNVMSASGDTKYFKGLPIPAAAAMIALTILLYFELIETGGIKDILILVMIYVLAFLMVSNVRYFSFKELNLARTKTVQHLYFRCSLDDRHHHATHCRAFRVYFHLCLLRPGRHGHGMAQEEGLEKNGGRTHSGRRRRPRPVKKEIHLPLFILWFFRCKIECLIPR